MNCSECGEKLGEDAYLDLCDECGSCEMCGEPLVECDCCEQCRNLNVDCTCCTVCGSEERYCWCTDKDDWCDECCEHFCTCEDYI